MKVKFVLPTTGSSAVNHSTNRFQRPVSTGDLKNRYNTNPLQFLLQRIFYLQETVQAKKTNS